MQSPLASHSTLKGFFDQKIICRSPCHHRQVAHFLSVSPIRCIMFPFLPLFSFRDSRGEEGNAPPRVSPRRPSHSLDGNTTRRRAHSAPFCSCRPSLKGAKFPGKTFAKQQVVRLSPGRRRELHRRPDGKRIAHSDSRAQPHFRVFRTSRVTSSSLRRPRARPPLRLPAELSLRAAPRRPSLRPWPGTARGPRSRRPAGRISH